MNRRTDRRGARCLVGLESARRFTHRAQHGNGKRDPPDGDGDETQSYRQCRVSRGEAGAMRQTDKFRFLNDEQRQCEQEPATDISECVAGGRDTIDFRLIGDVWQQRFIEGHAAGRPGKRQDERHRCEDHVPALNEEHRCGGAGADHHERDQELLLRRLEVGQCAKNRGEHGDEHGTDGIHVSPPCRCSLRIHARRRHLHEEDGEDRRHDDRLHAGDAPVVHGPRAQFLAMETECAEPSGPCALGHPVSGW